MALNNDYAKLRFMADAETILRFVYDAMNI